MLDSSTLSQLRNEFGGLQTLLRNHSQVFQGMRERCSSLMSGVCEQYINRLVGSRHMLVQHQDTHWLYRVVSVSNRAMGVVTHQLLWDCVMDS